MSTIMEVGGRNREAILTNIEGDHVYVCEISIYCWVNQIFYSAKGAIKMEAHSGGFYCKNEVIFLWWSAPWCVA